jgi:hypothetical protein
MLVFRWDYARRFAFAFININPDVDPVSSMLHTRRNISNSQGAAWFQVFDDIARNLFD